MKPGCRHNWVPGRRRTTRRSLEPIREYWIAASTENGAFAFAGMSDVLGYFYERRSVGGSYLGFRSGAANDARALSAKGGGSRFSYLRRLVSGIVRIDSINKRDVQVSADTVTMVASTSRAVSKIARITTGPRRDSDRAPGHLSARNDRCVRLQQNQVQHGALVPGPFDASRAATKPIVP